MSIPKLIFMRPALIRLSKKFLVDAKNKEEGLRLLHSHIYNNYFDLVRRQGATSWNDLEEWNPNIANKITKEIAEYFNEKHVKTYNKWPVTDEDHIESELTISKGIIKIIKGNVNNPNDFVFELTALTNKLTLFDNIDDKLILALDDKSKDIKEGKEIEVTQWELSKEFSIVRYSPIPT